MTLSKAIRRSLAVSRAARDEAADEAARLAEARRFVSEVQDRLQALAARSQAVRQRLRQTESFRRVDGKDEADQVPTWNLAATLEIMVELAAEEMADNLRGAMRTAPRPHAQRQAAPAGSPQ